MKAIVILFIGFISVNSLYAQTAYVKIFSAQDGMETLNSAEVTIFNTEDGTITKSTLDGAAKFDITKWEEKEYAIKIFCTNYEPTIVVKHISPKENIIKVALNSIISHYSLELTILDAISKKPIKNANVKLDGGKNVYEGSVMTDSLGLIVFPKVEMLVDNCLEITAAKNNEYKSKHICHCQNKYIDSGQKTIELTRNHYPFEIHVMDQNKNLIENASLNFPDYFIHEEKGSDTLNAQTSATGVFYFPLVRGGIHKAKISVPKGGFVQDQNTKYFEVNTMSRSDTIFFTRKEKEFITITGQVVDSVLSYNKKEEIALNNAKVIFYLDGSPVDSDSTGSDGKYFFEFPLEKLKKTDYKFQLEFLKEKHFPYKKNYLVSYRAFISGTSNKTQKNEKVKLDHAEMDFVLKNVYVPFKKINGTEKVKIYFDDNLNAIPFELEYNDESRKKSNFKITAPKDFKVMKIVYTKKKNKVRERVIRREEFNYRRLESDFNWRLNKVK